MTTATYTDNFLRADGALGSIPSGPAWTLLNGSITVVSNRALSSTAPGSNPLAVVDVGHSNHEIIAKPAHQRGNALYVRVQDASNWLRLRLNYRQTSYSYYTTEYEYNQNVWKDRWNPCVLQRQVQLITTTLGNWQGYVDTGAVTACRIGDPGTLPANENDSWGNTIAMYRFRTDATGCPSGKDKYYTQVNRRTSTDSSPSYRWVNDGYSLVSTGTTHESFTGSTQIVDSGAPDYYLDTVYANATTQPGYAGSTPTNSADQYMQTVSYATGTTYWATSPESTGPTDYPTGASRQAGPYTGYNYYYDCIIEKCVAGTITQLGNTNMSSGITQARLRAVKDKVSVYQNGGTTPVLQVTDSSFNTMTKLGIGGATSDYSPSNPDWDDVTVTGLNKLIWVGSSWTPADKRVYSAPGTSVLSTGRKNY